MPRPFHNQLNNNTNHSIYQTDALTSQTQLLEDIKTNTGNINLNVDSLELNTDTLETKIQTTNDKLDSFSGHTNNTTAIGDGSTQLRTVPLGYDRSNGKAVSFLVDSDGHQKIDIVGGGEIKSSLDSLSGAGNNNLGDGATKLQVYPYGRDSVAGQMKPVKVDTAGRLHASMVGNTSGDGTGDSHHLHIDSNGIAKTQVVNAPSIIPHSTLDASGADAPSTSIASTLKGRTTITDKTTGKFLLCDANGRLSVDVNSGGFSSSGLATSALQGDTNTKLDHISDNLDTLEATLTNIETDQAALEVLHTATNSKIDTLDAVIDNIKANTDLMTLTTTQLHNNVNIAGGADNTHATTITLGHNPNSITILATSASNSVPGSSITIGAMVSMDNSNFFDIAQATSSGTVSLVKTGDLLQEKFLVIPECRFKFLKVKITNSSGTATDFNSFVCF